MKQFNIEDYLKNPNQKLVTRDGRKVRRVLCTDARGPYPVIVLVESPDGTADEAQSFTAEGRFCSGESRVYDLFFVPEKHEGWINIYKGRGGLITNPYVFSSREDAEESSRHCCGYTEGMYLATAKVEWEE